MGKCIDCFDNCTQGIQTDKCVKYTGPDVPLLGICNGDSLYQVEAIIIESLSGVLDGSDITLSDVTLDCQFLITFFNGKEQTLSNLIQALLDRVCYQDENITAINEIIFAPISIDASCLSLGTSPTRDEVLQAVATKVCEVSTQITTISDDYVKESELCDKVNACITASSQYNSRMVPYIAYPYHGPLSNFDAGGIGLSANGFEKIYLCNGQSVGTFLTPDYRGRSPIGLNLNVPGGALDSSVDPSLAANSGYAISLGQKKGAFTDTLTVSQIPSHTHSVNDPGHSHLYQRGQMQSHPGGNNVNRPQLFETVSTSASTTGITLGSTGSSQSHNTTHPVMGCNFIMYIP